MFCVYVGSVYVKVFMYYKLCVLLCFKSLVLFTVFLYCVIIILFLVFHCLLLAAVYLLSTTEDFLL